MNLEKLAKKYDAETVKLTIRLNKLRTEKRYTEFRHQHPEIKLPTAAEVMKLWAAHGWNWNGGKL